MIALPSKSTIRPCFTLLDSIKDDSEVSHGISNPVPTTKDGMDYKPAANGHQVVCVHFFPFEGHGHL